MPQVGEDPLGRDLGGLVTISSIAAAGGLLVGFIGGWFRRLLFDADQWRADFLDWAHRWGGPGWVLSVVVVVVCVGVARLLVVRVPRSAGSGIQDVEAVWRKEMPATSWQVIPAKFVGGLLAIGSGLALGREGPTVHLGAAVGSVAGRLRHLSERDVRILQTSLGGAGLGVAFNAPFGGAMFVFEEVAKSIRLRLGLVTLIGTSTAIVTSRAIMGNLPDFFVDPPSAPAGWMIVVFVVFGIVTGFVGVGYNRLIMWFLSLSDRASRMPKLGQAMIIGAGVGVLLWLDPLVATGGGDELTQKLLGGGVAVAAIGGYFLVRFFLGPVSYAAQTAGGLFSPLLAVGALWGALVHGLAAHVVSGPGTSSAAFAIVGMSTLFAVIVRAPFTGIILIVEMTAVTSLVVPMLAAAFGAVITATLLRNEPIYDSLRGRMLAAQVRPNRR